MKRNLLVRDFLLPSLDDGRYGSYLHWVDERNGVFSIGWLRKGRRDWKEETGAVFKDWAIFKSRWNEKDPECMSKAKQRIRSALEKLDNIERIDSGRAHARLYRIINIQAYRSARRKVQRTSKKRPHAIRKRRCVSKRRRREVTRRPKTEQMAAVQETEEYWVDPCTEFIMFATDMTTLSLPWCEDDLSWSSESSAHEVDTSPSSPVFWEEELSWSSGSSAHDVFMPSSSLSFCKKDMSWLSIGSSNEEEDLSLSSTGFLYRQETEISIS